MFNMLEAVENMLAKLREAQANLPAIDENRLASEALDTAIGYAAELREFAMQRVGGQ